MTADALTPEEIARLRALLAASAPGPWRSMIEGRDHDSGDSFIMTGEGGARGEDIYLSGAGVADQDLIAAMQQALPRLLDELERLRSARVAAE